MSEVLVVIALGPNPASLVELAWALAQEGQRVASAHVIEMARTAFYIEHELLPPGAALDQLHDEVGADVLPRNQLIPHRASLPDGTLLADDDTDEHSAVYSEAVWRAARAAQLEAKERPVVFALGGGRRRTATAFVTTAFQLLGRAQDVCRDVRVDTREAEGATGFYFPKQPGQELRARDSARTPFRASDVRVTIPLVRLPRLRPLLRDEDLKTYAAAFGASEARLKDLAPPLLRIDFGERSVTIDGEAVRLSEARFLWLCALAQARGQGDGWLESDDERIRTLWCAGGNQWKQLRDTDAMNQTIPLQWLRQTLRDTHSEKGAALKKLRADVKATLVRVCDRRPSWLPWLIPEAEKLDAKTRQRLPLPADRIEIVGVPRPARR